MDSGQEANLVGWSRISVRLDELLELETGEVRKARLEELRAVDPALAEELDRLLAAHESADPLLDASGEAVGEILTSGSLGPEKPRQPVSIGPWQIVGVLGEGGMGRVFAAERAGEGFVQRAAVKVLRGDRSSAIFRERFLLERRIQSRLEHPGIARMLDAGMSEEGVLYLALERVDGKTILDACRERRATVEERLHLFLKACSAVEYAHRNLVVHRDLKPSNILIDGNGGVKLLDFGIAKLLDTEGEGGTAPTAVPAMTLSYAAPEQVLGQPITTATDVYSLGVVLFELLAGRHPFEAVQTNVFALSRRIVDGEMPRLPALALVDDSRPEGARLPRKLRGDLERIVERAMARDPERRYPSVGSLADDLLRYLKGFPVEARGDSLSYRAGRFLSRNRTASLLGSLGLSLLIGALIMALAQARRADREAVRARLEADQVAAARDFLLSLFGSADPNRSQGRVRTDREMLAEGVARLERDLGGRPDLVLPLQLEIAAVYLQLGEYREAERVARRGLEMAIKRHGPDALETARVRRLLAEISYKQERYAEAMALNVASGARLAMSRERTDRVQALEAEVNTAKTLFMLGRQEEAWAKLDRADERARREFGSESPERLHVLLARTSLLLNAGKQAEGALAAARTAELAGRLLGPSSPTTLSARLNEVVAAQNLGRLEEARRKLEGLSEQLSRVVGPSHDETLLASRLEARMKTADGDFARALAILESVIVRLRESDRDHALAYTLVQAAHVAAAAGNGTRAIELAREAVKIFEALFGSVHPDTAFARSALGQGKLASGDVRGAERDLEEALAIDKATGNVGTDFHADTLERLAQARIQLGRKREARVLLEQAVSIRRAEAPEGNRSLGTTLHLLHSALESQEAERRCQELLGESFKILSSALGPAHPERQAVERRLRACAAPD